MTDDQLRRRALTLPAAQHHPPQFPSFRCQGHETIAINVGSPRALCLDWSRMHHEPLRACSDLGYKVAWGLGSCMTATDASECAPKKDLGYQTSLAN